MTQKTLLTPLDGSTLSEWVLPYAEALAGATAMAIRLFAVVESQPRGLTARSERVATEKETRELAAAQTYLNRHADALRAHGLCVSTEVVVGEPRDKILSAASNGIDMVALATRGHGAVDRWLIGSVADHVMRLCQRPTLLVRPPYTSLPLRPVSLERIMVPLDGSPLAEAALPAACDLASTAQASLLLVRVEPWLTGRWAPDRSAEEFASLEHTLERKAQAYLEQAQGLLPGKLPCQLSVLRGRVAESLIDFTIHERVDLTVMTTHGRGRLSRAVLGSTADRLVRAGVPVLLLRSSSGDEREHKEAGHMHQPG
jgi:nucleotide-binding universal stress UspA family protein